MYIFFLYDIFFLTSTIVISVETKKTKILSNSVSNFPRKLMSCVKFKSYLLLVLFSCNRNWPGHFMFTA